MKLTNKRSIRTGILMLICSLFLLSCSSGGNDEIAKSDGEWETHSAGEEKGKSIDYSRPGRLEASSESINKEDGKVTNAPANLNLSTDVENKMFKEYGAIFSAKNGAVSPGKVVFNNESEVADWQASIPKSRQTINGIPVELQKPAMDALMKAINQAKQQNLSISPRGTDAAKRNYAGTVGLWKSRVDPGLDHWVGNGRIEKSEAERIRALPVSEQINEIFKLENQGIFFSTGKNKSIIYSVAPPGTSQHISMLALDVKEHDNPQVRDILANYGWFQTVVSDTPHFTYLGVNKDQLSKIGLKQVSNGGRSYWIPDA